jgi:hypothetical protein
MLKNLKGSIASIALSVEIRSIEAIKLPAKIFPHKRNEIDINGAN